MWEDINPLIMRLRLRMGTVAEGLENDLLHEYIEDAYYTACEYTGRTCLPTHTSGIILDLAIAKLQRRGLEVEINHSEGGVSMALAPAIPGEIAQRLCAYRIARLI